MRTGKESLRTAGAGGVSAAIAHRYSAKHSNEMKAAEDPESFRGTPKPRGWSGVRRDAPASWSAGCCKSRFIGVLCRFSCMEISGELSKLCAIICCGIVLRLRTYLCRPGH